MLFAILFFLIPFSSQLLNPPHTEPLIPKWSLGYWQSGWGDVSLGYANQSSFLDHYKALRGKPNQYGNHTYPADVIVLDMYWCDLNWNWPQNMEWSYSRFPDPQAMIQELHENHFKFSMNFHEGGGFGDEWLKKMRGFLSWGLDIVWLDFWQQGSSEEVQVWNLLKELNGDNKRIFFFGRHYARPNKYNEEANPYGNLGYDKPPFNDPIEKSMPMHWTGDQQGSWNGFMETIEEIVYGSDGVMDGWSYLHADTPGHIGGDDAELANRWIQFSDFSPFTRNHGAGPRDVWSWGAEVEENSRFSRMLRYRLLPYIYTYCWVIYEKALPLMRPLKLAYPGQRDDIRYQYMFGDEFLVSPVYQAKKYFTYQMMELYLPKGDQWVNYWTQEVFEGGQTIKVDVGPATDKYIPLFVRRGAIIPMGPQIYWIEEDVHPDPLTLDIYPLATGSSESSLYDDDGKSMEYQKGKYSLTSFRVGNSEGEIEVLISESRGDYSNKPESQDYIVKINLLDSDIGQVSNNGAVLQKVLDYNEILEGKAGYGVWAVDTVNNILYARIKTVTTQSNKLIFTKAAFTAILKSIRVTPYNSEVKINTKLQFKAEFLDQHGNPLSNITPKWASSGGLIDANGEFTSDKLGCFEVSAEYNNVKGVTKIVVSKSLVVSGGIYTIKARHSGKALDVKGGSKDNGAQIQQYVPNNTPSQQWRVIDLGDSFYRLEPQVSKKTLEVSNNSLQDGGRVQQWDFVDIECQIWRIDEVEDGFYRIVNVNSGKALDVEGESMDDGAIVHQWSYLGKQINNGI